MENKDLELGSGDVNHMIQLRLDHHVENEASHRNRSSPSIFMVPSRLRDLSPNSFNPKVVSIGPLHKDDINLLAFEEQKSRYLITLMSRTINYSKEEIWKTCMQKAYTLMNRTKACYVWPKTSSYSDDEIAEMMVIDACFILEFTYRIYIHGTREVYLEDKIRFNSIMDDLVLLENQIPLFFLDEIYNSTIVTFRPDISLLELIRPLLSGQINRIFFSTTTLEFVIDKASMTTAHHIFSLLHQFYTPPPDKYTEEVNTGSVIPSATDLDMAWVKVKPSENPKWVMGIEMKQHTFPYSPTLEMPVLRVQDSTEVILRNLIAYEHSFNTKMYFTSYFIAIDMLVNTQEDVAKLVDSGVIVNMMGSNKEVAKIINNLGKNVEVRTVYEEEWKKVNKYCDSYWPKHIARMNKTYFRSPWNSVALFAGIILFFLQVAQTIFAAMSS